MDRRSPEKSEAVRFAHRQKPHDQSDLIDQVGHALIALLQEAATVSKENVDRAMTVADKLSIQLRAAEGRIKELEDEVERLESRAARAEAWLQIIKTEIEDKLIGPIEANRPELPASGSLLQH
jgi:chromosome segregation ATPase